MLSPNAMNFVAVSVGARTTAAANEHKDVRCCASRAVHVTGWFPTGKLAPLAGVQDVVTGVAPPTTVGAGKLTGTAAPNTDVVVWLAGQEIVGGSAGTFVGPESPQPAIKSPARAASPALRISDNSAPFSLARRAPPPLARLDSRCSLAAAAGAYSRTP